MMWTQHFWIRTSSTAAASTFLHAGAAVRFSECIPFDRREVAGMANFKMYLLRQFCSNRVEIFYNTQETQTQKNEGPEF